MVTVHVDTYEAIETLLGKVKGFVLHSSGYYLEDDCGPRFIDGRRALQALLVRIPGVDSFHISCTSTVSVDTETVVELLHEIGMCSENYDDRQAAEEFTDRPLDMLLRLKNECEIVCCLDEFIEREPDTEREIELPK